MTDIHVSRPISSPRLSLWGWGVLVVCLSVGWSWLNLNQGFFPSDEGQMGQAAERVLNGELPHRDFDDMYTGALSYVNALSFYWWGIHCDSMRLMLLVWFVPFVAAIYWLATQFAQPRVAALVTLLAAAWSIPTYSAAAPSWHNLFFALWALCAVVKFSQTGQRRYLVIAGLMGGLSILFKITGVFTLAACLLFLLFRNQLQFEKQGRTPGWVSIPILVAVFLAGMLSVCFVKNDIAAQIMHFVIPFIGLTGFVFFQEWKLFWGVSILLPADVSDSSKPIASSTDTLSRLKSMAAETLPLIIGVAVPIAIFIGFYWQQGAIDELVYGVLIMPSHRLSSATGPFPAVNSFVFTIPYFVLLFPQLCGSRLDSSKESTWQVVAAIGGVLFVLALATEIGAATVFFGARNLLPLVVIGNLILLGRKKEISIWEKQALFLVTTLTFFTSLVQFPFALPIYFFYSAPLLVIAVLVSVRLQDTVRQKAVTLLVAFLILFSCLRYHSFMPIESKNSSFRSPPSARMDTNRCSFLTDAETAGAYNRLHDLIESETQVGETIFATPDAPEMSFFSGRRSINGVMYEFFHPGLYDDHSKVKDQLAEANINLVIINEFNFFSAKVTKKFRERALADFALLQTIRLESEENAKQNDEKKSTSPVFSIYKRK